MINSVLACVVYQFCVWSNGNACGVRTIQGLCVGSSLRILAQQILSSYAEHRSHMTSQVYCASYLRAWELFISIDFC